MGCVVREVNYIHITHIIKHLWHTSTLNTYQHSHLVFSLYSVHTRPNFSKSSSSASSPLNQKLMPHHQQIEADLILKPFIPIPQLAPVIKHPCVISLNEEVVEEVHMFKYLGSNVTASGDVVDQVVYRINESQKVLDAVNRMFKK